MNKKPEYLGKMKNWVVNMRIHAPEGINELNYVTDCLLNEVPGFKRIIAGKKRGDVYPVTAEIEADDYQSLQGKIKEAGSYVMSARVKWPKRYWETGISSRGKGNRREIMKRLMQSERFDVVSARNDDANEQIHLGFWGIEPADALSFFGEDASFAYLDEGEIDYTHRISLPNGFSEKDPEDISDENSGAECGDVLSGSISREKPYMFSDSYLTIDGKRLPSGLRIAGLDFRNIELFLRGIESNPVFLDSYGKGEVVLHYGEMGSKVKYVIGKTENGEIFARDQKGIYKNISELPEELAERFDKRKSILRKKERRERRAKNRKRKK